MACLKTSGTPCTSRDPSQWRLTLPGKNLQRVTKYPLLGGDPQELHGWDCQRVHGTPTPHGPVFTLSPQVPLYPLPSVPGHTLVSPHCHPLATMVETLSLGAPGIQRAQGPLLYVLALVYEALQGSVYVRMSIFVCLCGVPTHVADCWAVVFFREWQVCP